MGYRALLRDLLNGHYEHCGGEKQTLDVFEEALGWAGYCIVPQMPTEDMETAALVACLSGAPLQPGSIYRAMLAARPAPETPPDTEGA